jgi:hypothetical protein
LSTKKKEEFPLKYSIKSERGNNKRGTGKMESEKVILISRQKEPQVKRDRTVLAVGTAGTLLLCPK